MLLGHAVVVGAAVAGNLGPHMNNERPYAIANPPHPADTDRTFRGEYFEMYGTPQTTRYGDVDWHSDPVPLPADIVARFDGKVMVITGYEVNIVRQDGSGHDEIVPTFELYNHHYSGFMSGKAATLLDPADSTTPNVRGSHGMPLPQWRVQNGTSPAFPHIQAFSEGNGNEHRGSYRAFAEGVGQLIHSPTTWANIAMIINTNKRLTNDTSPGPIGGPLPKNSLAPPNADYSGILECPCTDRLPKVLDGYSAHMTGGCGAQRVATAGECGHAAAVLGIPALGSVSNASASAPAGCSAIVTPDGEWVVSFNPSSTAAKCGDEAVSTSAQMMVASGSVGGVAITLAADSEQRMSTLTMRCRANGSWFGVGLNATAMSGTWAIVVDGSGELSEHLLGNHAPGTVLPPSVKLVSSTVANGVRTAVVAIPFGSPYFHADALSVGTLPTITAIGSTPAFGYHKVRTTGTIGVGQAGAPECICRDPNARTGTIAGRRFDPDVCAPYPIGELVSTHNAICNISSYNGGLYCCGGGTVLLDSDQVQPPTADTWRMKYRFYFEEYTTQANLFRLWWSTEAYNNEYDVPKSTADCLDPATDPSLCIHTIRSEFTGRDFVTGGQNNPTHASACMVQGDPAACANVSRIEQDGGYYRLMYAAFHCHAPACISGELWNRDTGELICRNTAVYGTGYTPVNETGYVVAIPPCVWGTAEEGLAPPPLIHLDTNLTTIKRANNTNGHWGVMAMWQARGAYVEK